MSEALEPVAPPEILRLYYAAIEDELVRQVAIYGLSMKIEHEARPPKGYLMRQWLVAPDGKRWEFSLQLTNNGSTSLVADKSEILWSEG